MDIQKILDAGMRCFPIDERVTRIGLHPLPPKEDPPEIVIPERLRVLEEQGFERLLLLCAEPSVRKACLEFCQRSNRLSIFGVSIFVGTEEAFDIPDFTAPTYQQLEDILRPLKYSTYFSAICCRGGLGRSVVVDIAYRVKVLGQSLEKAIKTVLDGNIAVCSPFNFSEMQYQFLRMLKVEK